MKASPPLSLDYNSLLFLIIGDMIVSRYCEIMKALYLTDHGPTIDPNYPAPLLKSGEALIRVHLIGICATDLALISGYKGGYRGVLGHEFVGDVVESPDAPEWIGRRVVGEINVGCGECSLCLRGLEKHCHRRNTLGIIDRDGAMAEFLTLPIANLHEVPDSLKDEEAVFVEPLAASLEILEQVHIHPSLRVYLIGNGKMGMLIAQVLALTGCDLTVIGRQAESLQLLREWHGCKTFLVGVDDEATLAAQQADVVVEATGSSVGFEMSLRLVRPMGTIVLKSTYANSKLPFDLSQIVVNELTVIGSRCGPFEPALKLLHSGAVHVLPLIHAWYSLGEGVAALEHADRRGVLKVLISPLR